MIKTKQSVLKSFRQAQRSVVSLLCLLFLFNIASPSFAQNSDNSLNTGKVLLCTLQGLQWIDLNSSDDTQPTNKSHCIFCTGLDDDYLIEADNQAPQYTRLIQSRLTTKTTLTKSRTVLITHARAPPFIS